MALLRWGVIIAEGGAVPNPHLLREAFTVIEREVEGATILPALVDHDISAVTMASALAAGRHRFELIEGR